MLVLQRKINESIIINNEITVRILKAQGGIITLGIEAPKDVSIHREEIQEKINKYKNQEDNRDKE